MSAPLPFFVGSREGAKARRKTIPSIENDTPSRCGVAGAAALAEAGAALLPWHRQVGVGLCALLVLCVTGCAGVTAGARADQEAAEVFVRASYADLLMPHEDAPVEDGGTEARRGEEL